MMKIKGLIFDFDGLILDTETAEVHIWEKVFQQFGLVFPIDRYLQYVGHATDNQFVQNFMYDLGLSNAQIESALIEYEHLFSSSDFFNTPREGIREFIRSGKENGFHLGIASNSYANWVVGHLRNLKLEQFFNPICTREAVSNSKPDPEIYNLVLKNWNFSSQEVLAFEDSPNGIQAAKNAGIFCVAVPNPLTINMDISRGDLIFHSFTEMNLHEIIRVFEK
ncbi:MAG: HAD family hydrolase [Anaerolineaceae bacterium]